MLLHNVHVKTSNSPNTLQEDAAGEMWRHVLPEQAAAAVCAGLAVPGET